MELDKYNYMEVVVASKFCGDRYHILDFRDSYVFEDSWSKHTLLEYCEEYPEFVKLDNVDWGKKFYHGVTLSNDLLESICKGLTTQVFIQQNSNSGVWHVYSEDCEGVNRSLTEAMLIFLFEHALFVDNSIKPYGKLK